MISGEQFQSLSEISFTSGHNDIINNQIKMLPQNLHLIDYFSQSDIANYKIIFIYSHDIHKFFDKFFDYLNEGTTIITHNSDIGVDISCMKYLESSKIKKWFCQNRYIIHPKLFSLPIGLANSQWPHGNQNVINEKCHSNEKKYLVYKNFDIGTNLNKRRFINEVTTRNGIPMDFNKSFQEYIDILSKSCFVIAPPGNGVDCHRIWECLKVKSIPIVEYNECFSQFTHLPILFTNDWNKITANFLRQNMDLLQKFNTPIPELEIEYWRSLICSG